MDQVLNETMEIDTLCDNLSDVKINNYLNVKLVNDLTVMIREIGNKNTFDVDIYDICVSCGNNIVWDQEYIITKEDINWLSDKGKIFFLNTLNSFILIDNNEKYFKAIKLYDDIFELFCKAI